MSLKQAQYFFCSERPRLVSANAISNLWNFLKMKICPLVCKILYILYFRHCKVIRKLYMLGHFFKNKVTSL